MELRSALISLSLALLFSTSCGDSDSTVLELRVEGAGMHPILQDGTTVPVRKLKDEQPVRGQIIAFHAPTLPERVFVKRLLGLPGDTVEITPEGVKVNGRLLQEPYVTGATNCNGECIREIPAAGSPESRQACQSGRCYFVMGDNRQNSSDSRQGWLVPHEYILGYIEVD